MELFFQQKLSINSKVQITDENENPVYTGTTNGWTGVITLKDADNKKVAKIIHKNSLFDKSYTIKVGGKKLAKIKKKFSLINQNFNVKKLGWTIKGDFVAKEYTITKGEEVVATIKKAKLVSLLDAYSANITNEEDAVAVMCVVLVLNNILNAKKGKLLKAIK